MDHASLYSQIWSAEEVDTLREEYPRFMLGIPPIHPLLSTFAVSAQDPARVTEAIKEYTEWVLACNCWHCIEVRKKKLPFGISGQDVWYRLLLYCNGKPHCQLN